MSPHGATLEEQLSAVMDVLAKAAAAEMSQLFSDGSAALRSQLSRSLEEKEALRTRMRVMRRELLALRLRTRAAGCLTLARPPSGRPRTRPPGPGERTPGERTPGERTPGERSSDSNTQTGAAPEAPPLDAPGSSHVSGTGEGPPGGGHDPPFTVSKVEALSSLSADHSAAQSPEGGERPAHGQEPTVQGGDHLLIHPPEDRLPLQTSHTVLIKKEEDVVESVAAVEDCSSQRGPTPEAPPADAPGHAPGSSYGSSHSEELRILGVHREGEGPLAADNHDPPFTASGAEVLTSPSADHSVAASRGRGEWRVHLEQLTWHPGGRQGRPRVSSDEAPPDDTQMSVHDAERPYVCDLCTKRFTQKRGLNLHMDSHAGKRPYRCDQCTKCFLRKSSLMDHMTTHSKEKHQRCDQCTWSSHSMSNLRAHRRTHSGVKPHQCGLCMKSFLRKGGLKEHLRRHSGERPYGCDQCMRFFYTSSCRTQHRKTQHAQPRPSEGAL